MDSSPAALHPHLYGFLAATTLAYQAAYLIDPCTAQLCAGKIACALKSWFKSSSTYSSVTRIAKLISIGYQGESTRLLIISCAFILFLSHSVNANSFQPRLISTGSTNNDEIAFPPSVWGDRVIWSERKGAVSGVQEQFLSTGFERRVLPDHDQTDLRGDLLILSGFLRSHNLATGDTHVLGGNGVFLHASIGSEWVAWSSRNNSPNEYDVYARRIDVDGAPLGPVTQITSAIGVQADVDTDGEFVTWSDRSDSPRTVHLRNMATGDVLVLGDGDSPAIHNGRVVWSNDDGIWTHNIASGSTIKISSIPSRENPAVWNDQVIWSNSSSLYGHDVATGTSFEFELPRRIGYTIPIMPPPSIYKDTVVWLQLQRSLTGSEVIYDIYAMKIPEPGSWQLAIFGIILLTQRQWHIN